MTIQEALEQLRPFCSFVPEAWDTVLQHMDAQSAALDEAWAELDMLYATYDFGAEEEENGADSVAV